MPDARRIDPLTGGKDVEHPDEVLRTLAARQHGVVARRQLLAAGLTSKMIERRAAGRQLVALHRGVYAVGHDRLRREGWWMAAVLAAGPGARLSHRDAAALHGFRPPGDHVRWEVTTPGRASSTRTIRVYGTVALDAEDVTSVDGIPVTSVARTLVDLAGCRWSGSSSSSTAGKRTPRGRRFRTTGSAATRWSWPAGACCASRGRM
jgi:predicted transcriptional regulator of viral defense system